MESIINFFKESLILNFFYKIFTKDYSDNFAVRFLNLIVNKSSDFLFKLINKAKGFRKLIDESLIVNLIKKLTSKVWLINGIIFILCLNIPHTHWNNLYIVVLVFLVSLIYYLRNVFWNDGKYNFKNIQLGFVIFIFASIISAFISLDYSSTIRYMLFYMTAFLSYMNVACNIKTKEDLIGFCKLLFVMAILMGLYGLYQNAMGVEVNESYIDTNLNQGMKGRIFGSVENPNNFAEVLLMMIPLCGALFLGEKKWRNKIVIAILTCIPIFAMILTGTRSGWGALGFAALVFCLLWDKRLVPAFIIAACLAFVALPYVSMPVYNRVKTIFVSKNDHSMKYRDIIMNATKPVLRDNYISGIGIGASNYSRYIANNYEFDSVPPHSHNLYIQIWLEFGILGLIGLMMLIFSTLFNGSLEVFRIKKMKKHNRKKYDEINYIKYIIIAIVSGLVGYLVMGFLDYVLFYPRIMILFFVYVGVGRSAMMIAKNEREENE